MEKQHSLKLNTLMSLILTVSNFVFPLLTYTYVARVLGPEGTGKVSFVTSVVSYFGYFAALGIYNYGLRECANLRNDRERLSKLASELLSINIYSSIVAYVVLFISILIVPKFHLYTGLFVIISLNIILQTIGVEWLYIAMEKYVYITIRSIIFRTISVALVFIIIRKPEDVLQYGFISIFASSASNILNFLNSRKYIDYKKTKLNECCKHLHSIMVFFASTVAITIYSNFDTVMIGFINGDNEVGIYNASLKIKALVVSVSTAITNVMVPRMTIYVHNKEFRKYVELLLKSARVSMILGMPLAIYVLLNTEDILLFICGKDYLRAVFPLRILMVCVIVMMITNLVGNQILVAKGQEKRFSKSVTIGLFINLILNSILIPRWYAAGAAFATLMTEGFNAVYMGIGGKEEISYVVKNIKIHKYILSLLFAILAFIPISIKTAEFDVFYHLLFTAVTFLGIYYLSLLVMKEQMCNDLLTELKRRTKNDT